MIERDPLVSVVVPAWNAERTLRETLESVAAQTHAKLEILIVDDGSTDTTAEVARTFCARESRARLLVQDNQGVAAARNLAITEAQGSWIAPIDADDLWHPTKIEQQLAAASTAPEVPGFVYCWHRLIDQESRVIGSGPRIALDGSAFNRLAYLNPVENGSALLIRREALLEVGGYDSSLRTRDAQGCEDVLVQLQIARGHPVACVPEYLVGHRRHASNMSSGFDRMVRSWRMAYAKLAEEEPGVPGQVMRWVDGKCALDIAEQRAVSGDYGDAFRALMDAMRLDPQRSAAIIAYRLLRSAGRRIRRGDATSVLRDFSEVDPGEVLSGDIYDLPRLRLMVDRLNKRRLQRLKPLDQAGERLKPVAADHEALLARIVPVHAYYRW